MKHRSSLTRTFLAAFLVTAPLHAMATERIHAGSASAFPLSAMQSQTDGAVRAAAADGLITAQVNGAPFVATKAYTYEHIWIDGGRYLVIRHGATQRGNTLSLAIPVKDGELHVQDGRYELSVPLPDKPVPAMTYVEPAKAPPGFIGFASFTSDSGWIDLKFNADRTRLDATFEFEAAGEEHGDRIIRKGSFSVPHTDLPEGM